jgi:glycosyltransferase involved in cell wall biosynthesis
VLHVFPTFAYGGVPLRIVDVANRLSGIYEHACVALDGRTEAAQRLSHGTAWTCLDVPKSQRRWPRPVVEAVAAIRKAAPDLLCTYNWGAMDWALANTLGPRLPHVHFESGFGREEASRTLRRRDLYRRLALRGAAALVVPSQALATLAGRRKWIADDRIRHLANGVDLDFYRPPTGPQQRHDGEPVVATVTPLRAEKGLDRLIRLFAQVTRRVPARLVVCGDGPERPRLEALRRESNLDDRVTFVGQQADVRPVLHRCQVFAMSSHTEQMPNALLQAMACARPVVAFEAGDIAVMVPAAQRRYVVDQADDAGFVTRLVELLRDPSASGVLGAANRRRAETAYDIADMVAAYDRLYRAATGRVE